MNNLMIYFKNVIGLYIVTVVAAKLIKDETIKSWNSLENNRNKN